MTYQGLYLEDRGQLWTTAWLSCSVVGPLDVTSSFPGILIDLVDKGKGAWNRVLEKVRNAIVEPFASRMVPGCRTNGKLPVRASLRRLPLDQVEMLRCNGTVFESWWTCADMRSAGHSHLPAADPRIRESPVSFYQTSLPETLFVISDLVVPLRNVPAARRCCWLRVSSAR